MDVDYARAAKCAILSQDIYQDYSSLKFSECPDARCSLINQPDTDTQCALIEETPGESLIIVFRGSQEKADWSTNFKLEQQSAEFTQDVRSEVLDESKQVYPYSGTSSSGALMHSGFVSAYFSVRQQIQDYLNQHPIQRITVTGHSLGGALTTLCAVDIQYNFADRATVEAFTFGSPRVGNAGFRDSYNRRVPNTFRFVHGMDIVPALPRYWQGYRHVGQELHLGSRFSLNFVSQRIKDHAIAAYISQVRSQIQ